MNRPDPDELLDKLQRDEEKRQRGRLKIFFGASAGVGKTYAMLQAARRRADEGADVVVGIAETHGRSETAALLEGLDVLPLAHDRVSRPQARRVRSRRRARAQAAADSRRRTRAFECAGRAPSEALAGRLRTARRGHRRLHHGQRPAPRKPERRGRPDHRHPRLGDGARPRVRSRRRSHAGRPARRRTARPDARRQGLYAAAGRARGAQLLSQGQPDRAARAGVAPHRRPRRCADAGISRRSFDPADLAGARALAGVRRPGPGSDRCWCARRRGSRRA